MPIAINEQDEDCWQLPRVIRRVAVIGVGSAGLPMIRYLHEAGIEVVAYERNEHVGGIWKLKTARGAVPQMPTIGSSRTDYIPELPESSNASRTLKITVSLAEADEMVLKFAPPGPAYSTLKNNIPAPIMVFQDIPRSRPDEWYVFHDEHQAYLEEYARKHDLARFTRFNTRVEKVEDVFDAEGRSQGWDVWSQTLEVEKRGEEANVTRTWNCERFDAVVCASGHHNAPAIPNFPGLAEWRATWPDRMSHASNFRDGKDLINRKRVLVCGSGPSGSDIAREVAVYTEHVYVTTRPYETDDTPDTMTVKSVFRERMVSERCSLVPTIKRFLPITDPNAPGKVEMLDGTILEVDAVVFATGYYHSYPFLSDWQAKRKDEPTTQLVKAQYTVANLHLDLFYIPDPTLIMLGVAANISAFSFFEYHSQAVARVFSGAAMLPSQSTMAKLHLKRRALVSDRNLHVYGKVEEPRIVREISAWLNEDAQRLGRKDLPEIKPYSDDYMAVKVKTVAGLRMRDEVEDVRLARDREAFVVTASAV